MRSYIFYLDEQQVRKSFSPIRSRFDYASTLLLATKTMLSYFEPPKGSQKAQLLLRIEKMSRIFFITPSRIFSLNFPFVTKQEDDGSFTFSSHAHPRIDQRATSIAIGLLNDAFSNVHVFDFATSVDDANQVDPYAWALLKQILTTEDGYIRYDDDPDREDADRHPRHHLDVFYSNQATFKLGLTAAVTHDSLIDVLDTTTDCHFVSPRRQ